MYSEKVLVKNNSGLNARPATIFVETASKFKSCIHVKHNGVLANGKSYLGLLSLAIYADNEIEVIAQGSDEIEAVKKLVSLVESNFSDY
ncbi:MAG: HPr family phosphocarrier protein [Clostridia bacterium]|nr:HPr family phosphocarrier protein [Clostridia bacterium]